MLGISPAAPVCHDKLPTPIAPEPQSTREIPPSQFARIRALAKYGMTVPQVAKVYGVPIGEIERVLRKD